MQKLSGRKQIGRLAWLFAITYMVSYVTRINFGAIISEMEQETSISRSLLSMSLTGSFITYGIGQIVSGIIGDRFSPKKLISIGLLISTLMNLLIPLFENPYVMLGVWCVNGFAQAFMWPPMVRLMTVLLSKADYQKCVVRVLWGSSFGTMFVYLFSPLLIYLFTWKSVFVFSALCGTVMLFFWGKYSYEIKKEDPAPLPDSVSDSASGSLTEPVISAPVPAKKASVGVLFSPMMLGIMLCICLQGMLRDGVTTWMPTYISETYHLSNLIAILTGALLPLLTIAASQFTEFLYRKYFRNPLICSTVMFSVGALSALGVYLISGKSAVFSIILIALLITSMHCVNLILICMLPAFFERYGIVSTASGVLNACTYIGSASSAYGFAVLSQKIGWGNTLLCWVGAATLGAVMCLICSVPWSKKFPVFHHKHSTADEP